MILDKKFQKIPNKNNIWQFLVNLVMLILEVLLKLDIGNIALLSYFAQPIPKILYI